MVRGQDTYGKFKIFVNANRKLECNNCFGNVAMVLQYWPSAPKLPEGIKPEDTILGRPAKGGVGVTCGCYARGHRQIAHIEDRMKARAK